MAAYMERCLPLYSPVMPDPDGMARIIMTPELLEGGWSESLTFDEFKTLDDALRTNPEPTDLDENARDVWDIAEDLFDGCAAQVGV